LYRIAQEAITNVIRHASATKVGVILTALSDQATLIIEDDGQGFPAENPDGGQHSGSRFGLRGIRERLSLVGGALEIESARGHGAVLIAHVPLEPIGGRLSET
jgi:signal transduction histidine kinase